MPVGQRIDLRVSSGDQTITPQIVHRYRLLDTDKGLIGRKAWLTTLDEWAFKPSKATLLTLHAIGGCGKSALAWTWFNQLFNDRTDVAGGLWYSFSEPGASFGDFLQRLYTYVVGPLQGLGQRQILESVAFTSLFDLLRINRYIIVLDGFESLLKAYRLERTADSARADLANNAEPTSERARDLCQAEDENVTAFLTALDQCLLSRFLVTTRLIPAATLNAAGYARPFTKIRLLEDLEPDDVIELLEAYRVRGKRETILRVAAKFGRHALLVKLIAASVAKDRGHIPDFDRWLAANPGFEPTSLDVAENKAHVLQYALAQLTPIESTVLLHVASLRGAIQYDDLHELLVSSEAALQDSAGLQTALTTLDELKLIQWDRDRNSYDLHPLVRNTVWHRASSSVQEAIDERIIQEFGKYPASSGQRNLLRDERLLDVFFAFVRRARYNEAWLFRTEKFADVAFKDVPTAIDLSSPFLTDDRWPSLVSRRDRAECLLQLAVAYEMAGDSTTALDFYARHQPICPSATCMGHRARVLGTRGELIECEHIEWRLLAVTRKQHDIDGEIAILRNLAQSLLLRGRPDAEMVLRRIARLIRLISARSERVETLSDLILLRCDIARKRSRDGDPRALPKWKGLANREIKRAEKKGDNYALACAMLELAKVHREQGDLESFYDIARRTADIARRAGLIRLLVSALAKTATAALELRRYDVAGRLLDEAAGMAERGGNRLMLGGLRLQQARLAHQQSRDELAINQANQAYILAWCDGPPFADAEGLNRARDLLNQLGRPVPAGLPIRPVPLDWLEIDLDSEETLPATSWNSASPIEAQQLLYVPSSDGYGCEVENLIERAETSFERCDWVLATQWADGAVRLDPQGHDCWRIRARAHYFSGNLSGAIQDYDKAITLLGACDDITRAQYHAERGHARIASGQAARALEDLDSALVIFSHWSAGQEHGAKALALALLDQPRESNKMFGEAFHRDPENAWTHFYQGRMLAHRRNRKAAKEAFRRALTSSTPQLPPWMELEASKYSES